MLDGAVILEGFCKKHAGDVEFSVPLQYQVCEQKKFKGF